MSSNFCHLHAHSEYSLLDGLSRPEQLIEVAEENGQSHVAMTDHGTMGGYFRFQEAANKSHVTPIFGLESYFVPDINNDDKDTKAERFHLILLAENQQGLRNLMKLNRLAWTDGFYSKPRTDFEMLEEFGDGIIALSGCMGGSISQSIINDDIEQADKLMERFMGIFGDRFYLELQPWLEPDQQKVNAKLLDYADYLDVPAVGTIDCHYPRKVNRGAEEVLLAVGMSSGFSAKDKEWAVEHLDDAKAEPDVVKKMEILWPNRRIKFADLPLYVMPTHEAVEAFEGSGYFRPELIENTQVIADRCNAELKPGKGLLPSFTKSIGLKSTSESYLEEIAYFRLKEMGLDSEKYREVMKMELDIILGKNFSDYFLILWDICKWADRQGIRRGPARGSSGGSLLTYCLGITDVDPVKYDLLFWRFLSGPTYEFSPVFNELHKNE